MRAVLTRPEPWQARHGTSDPHNQYLKIAAEQGLVGLAVWRGTRMANSHFSTAEGTFIYLWLGVMLANETASRCVQARQA